MRIQRVRTLAGPNVYTYRPALLMALHLEDLAERESREFEGFNERLLALLPGLGEHTCAKGYPGGFVERLGEGTYFGRAASTASSSRRTRIAAGASAARWQNCCAKPPPAKRPDSNAASCSTTRKHWRTS